MTFTVFDGQGDELGPVDDIDTIPEWENALQGTAKQIANRNYGYIEDSTGAVVYDSQESEV